MKFNKIYTLLLAAALFTGCSDDDESWNNSSATVSMGQQELSFKENKGIVNIPIVVDGELNGPIRVTVDVAETGSNPAMDDVHYIVTSKSIVIPADATSGNIEMITVDDADINEARMFTMEIKSVEGAKVGGASSTQIILKDNDAAFYEKLIGKWKFVGDDDGSPVTWDINIIGFEEGEDGYDKTLYATGIVGYSWAQLELKYYFDPVTKKASVSIPMNTLVAENVNFGFGYACNVYSVTENAEGKLSMSGEIMGTINDDFTEITFEDKWLYGGIFNASSGAFSGSVWFGCQSIKFTK